MSDDRHPDFVKCAEPQRWKGEKLEALFMALHYEASRSHPTKADIAADRGWCWRVLKHGAFVGMRKRADVAPSSHARFELRVARSGELKPEVESRFETEVSVFLRKFQIKPTRGDTPAAVPHVFWLRLPPAEKDEGKPVARFLSLMLGEITPGRALCHDCGTEVDWSSSFGVRGQACNACALKRGEQERLERAKAPAEQSTLPI